MITKTYKHDTSRGYFLAYKGKGQIVTRAGLAVVFGVALPTVDSWVRSGCPFVVRGGRGKEWQFNTADVSSWLKEKAREEAVGDGPVDIDEARLRKLAAEAEMAELELAKAKGEVASIRDFERVEASKNTIIRQNIMNVPGRAVLQLLGCTDEIEFKEKLRAELFLALETAAKSDLELSDEEDQGE